MSKKSFQYICKIRLMIIIKIFKLGACKGRGESIYVMGVDLETGKHGV
jgi:hypothetical protein